MPMDAERHLADRLGRLQRTLHHEIPISAAIGLRVAGYDGGCLMLAAPLAPNINHKDTAFAGSINAVVTLTCWSLIWCILDEAALRGKIVIQDSSIQYLRPVAQDFSSRCCLPEPAQVQRFLKMLASRRRARLELGAEVWQAGELAVRFSGRYVVDLVGAAPGTPA